MFDIKILFLGEIENNFYFCEILKMSSLSLSLLNNCVRDLNLLCENGKDVEEFDQNLYSLMNLIYRCVYSNEIYLKNVNIKHRMYKCIKNVCRCLIYDDYLNEINSNEFEGNFEEYINKFITLPDENIYQFWDQDYHNLEYIYEQTKLLEIKNQLKYLLKCSA